MTEAPPAGDGLWITYSDGAARGNPGPASYGAVVIDPSGKVQREIGSSVVFVTHDLTVHANLADRLGIMYAGRLAEEGPTEAVFHR